MWLLYVAAGVRWVYELVRDAVLWACWWRDK